RRLGKAAQIDDCNQRAKQLGWDIGHCKICPAFTVRRQRGCRGAPFEQSQSAAVAAALPDDRPYSGKTTLWHLIFEFYNANFGRSPRCYRISPVAGIWRAGTRALSVIVHMRANRVSLHAPAAAAASHRIGHRGAAFRTTSELGLISAP